MRAKGYPFSSPCRDSFRARLHVGAHDILRQTLWQKQSQDLLRLNLEIPAMESGVGPLGLVELELPGIMLFFVQMVANSIVQQ